MKKRGTAMKKLLFLIIIVCLIVGAESYILIKQDQQRKLETASSGEINQEIISGEKEVDLVDASSGESSGEAEEQKEDIVLATNDLSDFDLDFLKMEMKNPNRKKNDNIIYSPLSIKYALKMVEEATTGNAKEQISKYIGKYTPTKYKNSENMSLANSLWIKDSFDNQVKLSYAETLNAKYAAEIKFDDFKSASNMNSWIKNKTLNLIDNFLSDEDVEDLQFALINALAIDMEWEEKFLVPVAEGDFGEYSHEKYNWHYDGTVTPMIFYGFSGEYSGMKVLTSINNYDIVNELGEENIRKTVGDAYRDFLHNNELADSFRDASEEKIEEEISSFLEDYIKSINMNYGQLNTLHHYKINVTDNEKIFVKDLKTYDGTTLQYVGIMPIKDSVETYINNTDSKKLVELIDSAKELKNENFKQGVITKIIGYIPKFKYQYNMNELKSNLNKLGITDIFDSEKANLTNLTDIEGAYISDAKHTSLIEFTQDGIKAAALTFFGGSGAGDWFDYYFDVPVEEIDITFDKPFIYIIRDKDTKETWFVGTVYEPLLYEKDTAKGGEAENS